MPCSFARLNLFKFSKILNYERRILSNSNRAKRGRSTTANATTGSMVVARNRPITLSRAKGILNKFAPGKYQFTEKIEAL